MPIKGVAPKQCPKCGRPTPKPSNYRFSQRGTCANQCRRCQDWKKYQRAEDNRRKKQARTAYAIWRKISGD